MTPYRVLILGGYGFFGSRLATLLSRQGGLHVTLAGRDLAQAQALALRLQPGAASTLAAAALDLHSPTFTADLQHQAPDVVVHTAGPFQGQDYAVARACLLVGAHYIDLADGREFVAGIGALDGAARAAGRIVISGASSVPALSGAVADALAAHFARIDEIGISISPGNRTERGLATTRAVLGYCGKALPPQRGKPVFGWSGARRHAYPHPVGPRLVSPCDVPDLVLLPKRYAGHPVVRFEAGLELAFLQRGLTAMAWLARRGLVRNWARFARPLATAAGWLRHLGTDAGAMHVQLTGRSWDTMRHQRDWHLVATHNDGPYVPTLAAAALVRQLKEGRLCLEGAQPCVGLLQMADFEREAAGLHITFDPIPVPRATPENRTGRPLRPPVGHGADARAD